MINYFTLTEEYFKYLQKKQMEKFCGIKMKKDPMD